MPFGERKDNSLKSLQKLDGKRRKVHIDCYYFGVLKHYTLNITCQILNAPYLHFKNKIAKLKYEDQRRQQQIENLCLRLTSMWLPSLISLPPIGSCKLKESSISHLNKLLVTHLARCGFEILHLSQLIQYRKNCIFYGNSSFKLVKYPLLALNPQYTSFFFFHNLSCKLHESVFTFQSKLFSQTSVMLNFGSREVQVNR